jgi:hypothetical protein
MKHKRARKLTRKQKIIISEAAQRLNVDNWQCIDDDGTRFVIQHKTTKSVKSFTYV